MRINYVLIDFESVQPESLAVLRQEHFKVVVFVGASQSKVPFQIVEAMQSLGSNAEYVKISGNGPNALDFHIAFFIGQLAAADPTAFFHIISKDTGFDPLIDYLKTKKIFAVRETAICDIPLIKTSITKTPEDRIQIIIERLRRTNVNKPRTVKTLTSHINAQFQKQLPEHEIEALVTALSAAGHIAITDNKINYNL